MEYIFSAYVKEFSSSQSKSRLFFCHGLKFTNFDTLNKFSSISRLLLLVLQQLISKTYLKRNNTLLSIDLRNGSSDSDGFQMAEIEKRMTSHCVNNDVNHNPQPISAPPDPQPKKNKNPIGLPPPFRWHMHSALHLICYKNKINHIISVIFPWSNSTYLYVCIICS